MWSTSGIHPGSAPVHCVFGLPQINFKAASYPDDMAIHYQGSDTIELEVKLQGYLNLIQNWQHTKSKCMLFYKRITAYCISPNKRACLNKGAPDF